MELDELKKSWNTLDEHLKRKKLTDETQIAKMIATHKADAQKSIGRLSSLQRLSLSIGIVGLTLLLTIWLIRPSFISVQNGNLKSTHLWFSSVSAYWRASGGITEPIGG